MSRIAPEEHVTELMHRLADHARTEPSTAGVPVVDELSRRRRRPLTTGMVAAVVAVVALVGASLIARDRGDRRVVTAGGLAALPGAAERLTPSGLAGRSGASSAWTGKELLVWGGLTLVDNSKNV